MIIRYIQLKVCEGSSFHVIKNHPTNKDNDWGDPIGPQFHDELTESCSHGHDVHQVLENLCLDVS